MTIEQISDTQSRLTADEGCIITDGSYPCTMATVPNQQVANWREMPKCEYESLKRTREIREVYLREVKSRIAARYSPDEESAIQRKALALLLTPAIMSDDTDNDSLAANPEKVIAEFTEYNTFAEQVKAEVAAQAEQLWEAEHATNNIEQ
ncbi:MAG: hypothetical protein K2M87_01255 [Muribaculaceae bacterium]|nr:hypothetical protein [Muribaculaceae bacterium]